MDNQQTQIKKCFLFEIYKDILWGVCILILVIGMPILLSQIFTPDLIAEVGYVSAWAYWLLGIAGSIGLIMIFYCLITEWIKSRWGKAEREVMEKDGRRKKPF